MRGKLTPATVELSGADAMFVLPDADLTRVTAAIVFGLRLNASATCIAPRRVFVPRPLLHDLQQRLAARIGKLGELPVDAQAYRTARQLAERSGGTLTPTPPQTPAEDHPRAFFTAPPLLVVDPRRDAELLRRDLFAPIVSLLPYEDLGDAVAADAACPYALGASIFGPRNEAEALSRRLRAGSVTINDLIVPTADPRVPFGGTGESGFGVTRGDEGLLAMTRPQTVMHRRGTWRPHFDLTRSNAALFDAYLQLAYGPIRGRAAALSDLIRQSLKLSSRS